MLHLGLAMGVVLAAEPDPLWRSSATGLTALGGADRVNDASWAPSTDLRAFGSWGRARSAQGAAGGGWVSVTGLPTTQLGWLDSEGAWVDLTRGPAVGSLWLRSGALLWSPWAELAATGGAWIGPLQLSAGPALRGARVPGALAQASLGHASPTWSLWTQVEGRTWTGDLPSSADWLVSASFTHGPWTASAGAGAWINGGVADPEVMWVAGLNPDTRGARALLAAERELGPVELRVELSAARSWGLAAQDRLHAAVGVGWDRSRTQPVPSNPGAWRLELHLPDADSVALVGSFNGWQPVPLDPGEGGVWILEIDLPPGRHEVFLLVDGVSQPVPGLPTQPDGFGGQNSILNAE